MLQAQRLQGQALAGGQAHIAHQPAALVGTLGHGHGEGALLSGIRPFHAYGTRGERRSLDLDQLGAQCGLWCGGYLGSREGGLQALTAKVCYTPGAQLERTTRAQGVERALHLTAQVPARLHGHA